MAVAAESYPHFRVGVVEKIEQEMKSLIGSLSIATPLEEALRYMLLCGGKRLRPLLVMCLAHDLGNGFDCALNPALSLEILHTASLIHDDLPSIDNDNFRRGRPSLHVKVGEGVAILAADFMVALAFRTLAETSLPLSACSELLCRVSRAWMQLNDGQVRDILAEEHHGDAELIHELKTAALFSAAAASGALCAGQPRAMVDLASSVGHELGMVFQAADDYKDLFGEDQERGRPGSSDMRNQRATLFMGLSQAEALKILTDKKAALLSIFGRMRAESGEELEYTGGLIREICQQ